MAHNEEKYKYSRLIFSNACSAQSTLEFAVVFLILFFMILGIFELGFMWHQNNSVEFAAQDLSANLALLENWGCNDASTPDIVARKTSILASGVNLTFNSNTENFVTTYESEQLYGGKPFVRVKITPTKAVFRFLVVHDKHCFSKAKRTCSAILGSPCDFTDRCGADLLFKHSIA